MLNVRVARVSDIRVLSMDSRLAGSRFCQWQDDES
jgi:hypothetical protein